MKLARYIFAFLALVCAAKAGILFEESHVQATCENQDAVTELNGAQYVCLTADQFMAIKSALQKAQEGRGA
jgi:hypothetical protein